MKSSIFIIKGREILWTVYIFMMTSQNIFINKQIFHNDRSSFLWWQVNISLRTVAIFMVVGPYFQIIGWDFIINCSFSW